MSYMRDVNGVRLDTIAVATDQDVSDEADARVAGDSANATSVTNEATARANADTALAGQITTEATTRGNADTTLQTNINAEAATRAAADTALGLVVEQVKPPGAGVIGQIGASISSNGALSAYDRALSGCINYGALAIMGGALPRTKGRFTAGGVAASNGFTTTQMIATHLPTVVSSNWDYCIVGEVTNDLGNGFPITDTRDNIETIVAALVAARIKPILTTVPPGDTWTSGATLTWVTQYNEWVKVYARENGYPLVDYHSVLVNPATNAYAAGYSTDGIHPNATGVNQMSIRLAEVLNSIPGPVRYPVEASYNTNLLVHDVAANSAGSDKIVAAGSTAGGWAFALASSTKWKGNAPTIVRGSGDYSISWPITPGAIIPGNRIRVAFNIDVAAVTASGGWSAYLYNSTQAQVVAGLSGLAFPVNDGSSTCVTDGAVAATNVVTCATSKPFRPNMVGNTIYVMSGATSRYVAGTTIIGVSADGTQAYLSAATATTASAQTVIVQGTPLAASFEFDAQPDMAGDTFAFFLIVTNSAGVCASASQVTLADLTALGAVV